jgi:hypothetical protein
MHQIAYMSQATRYNSLDDLKQLCETASAHNRRADVTGLLIYDGKRFMQVIEGDATSVRSLMNRIAADNRHSRISYIADGSLYDRQFGDWGMACVGFSTNMNPAELLAEVKKIVVNVADRTLKAALIGFALLAS